MNVTLITQVVGGITAVMGYYSDPDGDLLPEILVGVTAWLDSYGNPLFKLASDGVTVVATVIAPNALQIAARLSTDQMSACMSALPSALRSLALGNGTDPLSVAMQNAIKGVT